MIFEITPQQIAQLQDADLRELVARLCQQELRTQQHSPSAVTWGGHQDAPDGGIDVRVSLPATSTISGYIPKANTGFQAKATSMQPHDVRDEMAPGGVVRPSIAELAETGGAYIIVSSRESVADPQLRARLNAMKQAVAGLPFGQNLTSDFYDCRRLTTWINQHEIVRAWLRDRLGLPPLTGWHAFGDWSSTPAPLEAEYLLDNKTRLLGPSIRDSEGLTALSGINRLREILRDPRGIVRLAGLSGVGKTRLIQALFDARLGESGLLESDALYTDVSDHPNPVPQEMLSRLIALGDRIVMIVDNCGSELHGKLASRIANSNGLISLITVEYDINDDQPENTQAFTLEPASPDLIEGILERRYPDIAQPSRQVIARFSEGNSRVALVLAATARHGESLTNLNDYELFKRLFYQQRAVDDKLLHAAKACALLYSFEGETLDGDASELRPLAMLAGLTVDELYKYIAELRRRQLVQTRGPWRAILPQALGNRLAKLALEDIPFQRITDEIVNRPSIRMLLSFSRRIGYLHDNPHAVGIAEQWFAPHGLLHELGKLSRDGDGILENIAPVKPDATLAFFEAAAQKNESWFFGPENRNRAAIVRTTRSIAYDPTLFDRCVQLLARFALNESLGGQESTATDALKSLFWIYLSGTHASPAQRASFIQALLASNQSSEQQLGTALVDAMLQTSHFSSHYSFEFGAWKRDYGFHPTDSQQIRDWYARAIGVISTLGTSTGPLATRLRAVLATRIPELLPAGMLNEVRAAANTLSGHDGWPEGWIGVRSTIQRHKADMPSGDLASLQELERRLRPKSLTGVISAYALSPDWTTLDFGALLDEEPTGQDEARGELLGFCVELGEQLAGDPEQLNTLLPEMAASTSSKTFQLGEGLAAKCESLLECWNRLRDGFLETAESRRNQLLLAGFLAQAALRDIAATEAILDCALLDPRLHPYFVYLQVNAKVNERGFERLLRSLTLQTIPVSSFRHVGMGQAHKGLDDEQLRVLLNGLSAKNEGNSVAVEVLGMRIYGTSDQSLISESLKATSRELLANVQIEEISKLDYLVGKIIDASFDSSTYEEQARALCVKIAAGVRAHGVNSWDVDEVITALARNYPLAILDVLVEQTEEGTRHALFQDLRTNREHPLHVIPTAVLLSWAAQKPDTRFENLARVVGFSNTRNPDDATAWSPVAEKLIATAPEPTKPLNIFLKRFRPSGYSGSLAETLATRLPLFESLKGHARPEVAAWAEQNAVAFRSLIERQRAAEAGEDRRRDERFE